MGSGSSLLRRNVEAPSQPLHREAKYRARTQALSKPCTPGPPADKRILEAKEIHAHLDKLLRLVAPPPVPPPPPTPPPPPPEERPPSRGPGQDGCVAGSPAPQRPHSRMELDHPMGGGGGGGGLGESPGGGGAGAHAWHHGQALLPNGAVDRGR